MVDPQTASLGRGVDCIAAAAGDCQWFVASSKKTIRMDTAAHCQTQNRTRHTKSSSCPMEQNSGNNDVQRERKCPIVGRCGSTRRTPRQRHHQSPLQEPLGTAIGFRDWRRNCIRLPPFRFHREPS